MPATLPVMQSPYEPTNASLGLSRDEFEFFVVEYEQRLLQLAKRLMKSQHDAEDALQDGLVSAFQARATFSGQSTVYTWLYKIVVNSCLMRLRATSRRTMISLDSLLEFGAAENWLAHSEPHRVHEECHLERHEANSTIHACIRRLPEKHREVLVLRDLEELDTEQTAMLLGLSRGAVKTRLHRARQALRALLESHEFDFSAASAARQSAKFLRST